LLQRLEDVRKLLRQPPFRRGFPISRCHPVREKDSNEARLGRRGLGGRQGDRRRQHRVEQRQPERAPCALEEGPARYVSLRYDHDLTSLPCSGPDWHRRPRGSASVPPPSCSSETPCC